MIYIYAINIIIINYIIIAHSCNIINKFNDNSNYNIAYYIPGVAEHSICK